MSMIITQKEFMDAMKQVNEGFAILEGRIEKLEATKKEEPTPTKAKK
jgi:hypothetical protein|tara:strand:- start:31 stop:171 length:141 start_codon:yes stop_codon:yes gene_type:complete